MLNTTVESKQNDQYDKIYLYPTKYFLRYVLRSTDFDLGQIVTHCGKSTSTICFSTRF